jgi:hypothetical protein
MKKILTLMLAITITSAYSQDKTYLCVSELSTGFSYEKKIKKWVQTKFITENEKYVLKQTKGTFSAKHFDGLTNSSCENSNANGFLNCKIGDTELFFNTNTKRFQVYVKLGYVGASKSTDEFGYTPSLTIGTCTEL